MEEMLKRLKEELGEYYIKIDPDVIRSGAGERLKNDKTLKISKEKRKESDTDFLCPECSMPRIPRIEVKYGFFSSRERRKYKCRCGCEWVTEWKKR